MNEYGRSVIDDPAPGEICLDEAGRQITEGAKTFLKAERDSKETEEDRIEEIRKYPWTWFEAKMTTAANCQFPAQILTKRLEELRAMPHLPYVRGNFEWVNGEDGDVEFVRDDISGRFQVAWFPDHEGGQHENSRKIINNEAFLSLLKRYGIVEIFPEDYEVSAFAAIVANAHFIISIHGSGLSNLCFAGAGCVVVDILAPWHQDSYYWMISNIRKARYIGFFSEGIHPADDLDLVQFKVDQDITVNTGDLEKLLSRELAA